ncbi:hypothetical protein Cadr_000023118 [Camelus dromedarius]|uniref:Uncharacterized protein n=1 Tax=Camelus dromedarius TaxID=9838 RepID=A0A5N4CIY1_CAMDR|nr:hypothetical protein Cadr_000023118 [Camelus dromedarius]
MWTFSPGETFLLQGLSDAASLALSAPLSRGPRRRHWLRERRKGRLAASFVWASAPSTRQKLYQVGATLGIHTQQHPHLSSSRRVHPCVSFTSLGRITELSPFHSAPGPTFVSFISPPSAGRTPGIGAAPEIFLALFPSTQRAGLGERHFWAEAVNFQCEAFCPPPARHSVPLGDDETETLLLTRGRRVIPKSTSDSSRCFWAPHRAAGTIFQAHCSVPPAGRDRTKNKLPGAANSAELSPCPQALSVYSPKSSLPATSTIPLGKHPQHRFSLTEQKAHSARGSPLQTLKRGGAKGPSGKCGHCTSTSRLTLLMDSIAPPLQG